MSNFKINFQLQKPNKIKPFGEKPHLELHWFGLTDGLLWINMGTQTVYEYSKSARKYFKHPQKYNDYYISRFLEDFFNTFKFIREPIPKELYENVESFDYDSEKWLASFTDEPDGVCDKIYNEYFKASEWRFNRSFDSCHLEGGPYIGCFRCGDKIKIIWKSNSDLDNGKSIWTAPNGSFELPYVEFVLTINEFLQTFFIAMDKQVENALNNRRKQIFIDKEQLIKEHAERKASFLRDIALLNDTVNVTDWNKITAAYSKMQEDLSKITQ